MPRRPSIELASLAILLAPLTACELTSARLPESENGETVEALIEYGVSLRSRDDAELEALYRELNNGSEPGSSASTMRLALLVGYGDSGHYDLDRAINLLNQVARTRRDEDPALRTFAELMAATLIERRSIAVERASLAERATASEQRIERDIERIEQLQNELSEVRSDLLAERERGDTLQSQLEALIELEEQLTLDEVQPEEPEDER